MKSAFIRLYRIISFLMNVSYIDIFIKEHPILLLDLLYKGDFWKLRESCISRPSHRKELLYFSFLRIHGAFIGLDTLFDEVPIFPHSLYGVFISNNAHIGKKVVIFQQVTIGSNTAIRSKNQGSPTICDSVYIGSGAKIIGNCTVGKNCRIGANCIVTKDVPDNSVCVIRGMEVITKEEKMDNTFVPVRR